MFYWGKPISFGLVDQLFQPAPNQVVGVGSVVASSLVFSSAEVQALARDTVLCNISNTRDSVSSGYPNTEKRVANTTRSGVFLNEIRGVWIADETLSRVFEYIFSM